MNPVESGDVDATPVVINRLCDLTVETSIDVTLTDGLTPATIQRIGFDIAPDVDASAPYREFMVRTKTWSAPVHQAWGHRSGRIRDSPGDQPLARRRPRQRAWRVG